MYGTPKKKPKLTILERKDITDYVRSFVLHVRHGEGRVLKASHRGMAEYMKGLINLPENTTFKSMRDFRDGYYFWHDQKVDFVPSNLGQDRGFIFYFVCNGCGRRAKYLYEYSTIESPLCHVCCRLHYPAPSRRARDISRLLRKPYLSSEAKYMLIRRAGITAEDVAVAIKQFTGH